MFLNAVIFITTSINYKHLSQLKKVINSIFRNTFNHYNSGESFQLKIFLTFVISAFSLVCINYLGDIQKSLKILYSFGFSDLTSQMITTINSFSDYQLLDLNYWALCSFFFYFIVPVLIIKFIFKDSLSNYGLSLKGISSGLKIYLFFLLFMLPLVWIVSFTDSFQHTYPFYKMDYNNSSYKHLLIWEGFYFLQFVGLEFFFRGFMVHSLKKQFGFYSIFIMMLPYCMIHFGKPLPETIGAIFAGIILGALSLKSNSIWLGVLLHFSVAIAMDCFSLLHR